MLLSSAKGNLSLILPNLIFTHDIHEVPLRLAAIGTQILIRMDPEQENFCESKTVQAKTAPSTVVTRPLLPVLLSEIMTPSKQDIHLQVAGYVLRSIIVYYW